MQRQMSILDQCSSEEFFLLSQINFLMQKQNSLVEKAKDIAMQEFLDDDTAKRRPDGTDYKNESSRVVELMEQRTESLK